MYNKYYFRLLSITDFFLCCSLIRSDWCYCLNGAINDINIMINFQLIQMLSNPDIYRHVAIFLSATLVLGLPAQLSCGAASAVIMSQVGGSR